MKLIDYINSSLKLEKFKNQLIFTENNENSLLQEVRITEIPDDVEAFSLDKEVVFSKNDKRKLFNEFLSIENEFINKRCDGVLIFQDDNQIHILICEMKSEKPTPQKYEYQLQNVGSFVQYLIDLYLKFSNQKLEIKSFKYVLFFREKSNGIIKKEKIVYEPTKKFKISKMNNFNDEIIKYNCNSKIFNHVKFNELIEK